jgi:DNA-binding transcriptional ArsR family regulator
MPEVQQPSEAPLAERIVSDVETLKALSDPVRLRILETMIQAADEAWTVKRIATALGVGPTKLYHHIAILEERDLIRVAGTRVVSGIIETSYRIAQLGVRLDRSLLSGSRADDAAEAIDDVLRTIFDTAREDVARAIRSGSMRIDPEGAPTMGLLRQDLKRLTPARAAELKERLGALLEEYDGDTEASAAADAMAFGLLVGLAPIESREERTDG